MLLVLIPDELAEPAGEQTYTKIVIVIVIVIVTVIAIVIARADWDTWGSLVVVVYRLPDGVGDKRSFRRKATNPFLPYDASSQVRESPVDILLLGSEAP